MALPTSEVKIEVSVVGARKYERDIKKAQKTLKDWGNEAKALKDTMSTLTNVLAPSVAAFMAAQRVMSALVDVGRLAVQTYAVLGRRGGAFSAVAQEFRSIADPALLGRLQELSGWHLQQQTLMASYNRVMSVGAVTSDQFEEVVQRVTSRAQEMGVDVEAAFSRFSNAMAGRDMQQAFSEMGLTLDGIKDAVARAGHSMESEAGSALAFRLALEQLREEQGDVDNSAQNLADSWDAWNTQIEDAIDNMGEIVSTSPAAIAVFETLRERIFGAGGAAQDTGRFIAEMFRDVAIGVSEMARQVVLLFIQVQNGVVAAQSAIFDNPLMRWLIEQAGLEELEGAIRGFHAQAAAGGMNLLGILTNVRDAALGASTLGTGNTDPRRRGGGSRPDSGGGDAAQAQQDLMTDIIDFQNARAEGEQAYSELQLAIHEQQREHAEVLQELRATAAEEQMELNLAIHEQMTEHEEARLEAIEAEGEARQESFDRYVNSFEAVANGTSAIMGNITGIMEATGASAEKVAQVEGAFLIAYNSVMAATEVAKAIGAYPDVVGMIQHGLAAAAHVTAAALAASQLGGGTTPSAPSAAVSSVTPHQTPEPDVHRGETGGSMIVNNNYSLGRTNAEIGEALGEATYDFERTGGRAFANIAPRIR